MKLYIAENLYDLALDKYFLNMTPKYNRWRKVDKLNFTKMKIYS